MSLKIVYLARLRDAFGCSTESLDAGANPTLEALLGNLRARGGAWAHELAAGRAVRVAINHDLASGPTALRDGDEIAFLPPVTGG